MRHDIHVWIIVGLVILGGAGFYVLKFQQSPTSYAYTFFTEQGENEKEPFQYGERTTLSNPDFYEATRQELIQENIDFIEANLSLMVLRVYQEGAVTLEVPILSKGRKGSWWETPAGLYKVEYKSRDHASSFSPVRTPWNIQFQGNFFIHGWPSYVSNGQPVDSTFSGGCIRLSSEDAQKVYNLALLGMPVLVFEEISDDTYSYIPTVPNLSATQYLAADLKNNYVFLEKDSTAVHSFSLVTKFLTALVVTDHTNIDKLITVPPQALVPTWKPRLIPGERYSIYQLLFPLLIESSNESAQTLAYEIGEERFVNLINRKAQAIGMSHAVFVDASGVSQENKGTLEDVFNLSQYLYNYRKFILNLSINVVDNGAYEPALWKGLEVSTLSTIPGYVGGVAGVTEGGKQVGFAVVEISFGEVVRPIVVIASGSADVLNDLRNMIGYVRGTYR